MKMTGRDSSRRNVMQDLGLCGHCCLWLQRAGRAVRAIPEAAQELKRLRLVWWQSKRGTQ
jgi:hypothetical protein